MPPEPTPRPIERILVAGGGVAAWLAALALARALPAATVRTVVPANALAGPVDLYAGCRPRFADFLAELGLDPLRLLGVAGGTWRLGQQFDGWGREPAFACFGETGATIDRAPFHLAWARAGGPAKAGSFFAFNPAAVLARAGGLPPADSNGASPLASAEAGFNFDPSLLSAALRAATVARGIGVVDTGTLEIEVAGDRIAAVVTDAGRLDADLFVDATGPAASLLSALDASWLSWAEWLPLDRILPGESAAVAAPLPLDHVVATGAGWRMEAPLARLTLHLHVHCTAAASPGRASRILRTATGATVGDEPVVLAQGRRPRPWIGNCVAIGDAAVQVEPLGGWPLDLLQFAIERLVDHLPDTGFAPVELDEHARVIARHADQIRDLLVLQHATLFRDAPAALTPGAEATLRLFAERGRVPAQDSSPVELEDWLAPLIGGGTLPAQPDPRTDGIAPARFAALSRTFQARLADAVAAAPRHRDALAALRAVA